MKVLLSRADSLAGMKSWWGKGQSEGLCAQGSTQDGGGLGEKTAHKAFDYRCLSLPVIMQVDFISALLPKSKALWMLAKSIHSSINILSWKLEDRATRGLGELIFYWVGRSTHISSNCTWGGGGGALQWASEQGRRDWAEERCFTYEVFRTSFSEKSGFWAETWRSVGVSGADASQKCQGKEGKERVSALVYIS